MFYGRSMNAGATTADQLADPLERRRSSWLSFLKPKPKPIDGGAEVKAPVRGRFAGVAAGCAVIAFSGLIPLGLGFTALGFFLGWGWDQSTATLRAEKQQQLQAESGQAVKEAEAREKAARASQIISKEEYIDSLVRNCQEAQKPLDETAIALLKEKLPDEERSAQEFNALAEALFKQLLSKEAKEVLSEEEQDQSDSQEPNPNNDNGDDKPEPVAQVPTENSQGEPSPTDAPKPKPVGLTPEQLAQLLENLNPEELAQLRDGAAKALSN
jgi:hypothetical protein